MAKIITQLNKQTLSRMTSGEKRFARRLEALLRRCWRMITRSGMTFLSVEIAATRTSSACIHRAVAVSGGQGLDTINPQKDQQIRCLFVDR